MQISISFRMTDTCTDLFAVDSDQRMDHHPVTDRRFRSTKVALTGSNGNNARRCNFAMETPDICELGFRILLEKSKTFVVVNCRGELFNNFVVFSVTGVRLRVAKAYMN